MSELNLEFNHPIIDDEPLSSTSHQLSSSWTLWSQVISTTRNARPSLGPIFDFNTVEEFWAIFNSLKPPSLHNTRLDLLFFRSERREPQEGDSKDIVKAFDRIHPEWEDANNLGGGEYRVNISGIDQDKQWELTLLAILGESLDLSEDVAGVWLGCGRRHGNTLALWKKTPDEQTTEDSVQKLGDSWLNMLKKAGIPVIGECTYTTHQTAINATKKTARNTFAQPEVIFSPR